jgi:hypothetical protein
LNKKDSTDKKISLMNHNNFNMVPNKNLKVLKLTDVKLKKPDNKISNTPLKLMDKGIYKIAVK